MADSHPNPFNLLPLETLQTIATQIETDSDLCTFKLICRSTLDAVDADNGSFWRRRFLSCFDKPVTSPPTATTNVEFKAAYQRRRQVLKCGAHFYLGDTRRERECLEVVGELIRESFSTKTPNDTELTYHSANMAHIHRFLLANNLLQIVLEPPKPSRLGFSSNSTRSTCSSSSSTEILKPTSLLTTLQVICAPMLLSFEPHIAHAHYCFPDSQVAVYSTKGANPLFGGAYGLDVYMEFLLHHLNFWKYHMVREVENTLFYAFDQLDVEDRPRWWNSPIQHTTTKKLGKHWKGSYAYVDREDIRAMRRGRGDLEQIQDLFAGEDQAFAFQDVTLGITPEGEEMFWPETFESILHSLTPPPPRAKTRAQKRSTTPEEIKAFKPLSFHFEGEGQDSIESFSAAGWLNPFPPQQGIPGWQRLTMMKYFEDPSTGSIDWGALWAYEGVVVPGGQVILGRWWSPNLVPGEEIYSGPFVLWCVDGPKYEVLETGEGLGDGEE